MIHMDCLSHWLFSMMCTNMEMLFAGRVVIVHLKWYYDKKITFVFSPDFDIMFTKHFPSEIFYALILRRRLFI